MKAVMGAKLDDGGGGSGEVEFPGADVVRCADSPRLPWTRAYLHGPCYSSHAASASCLSPSYRLPPTVQAL